MFCFSYKIQNFENFQKTGIHIKELVIFNHHGKFQTDMSIFGPKANFGCTSLRLTRALLGLWISHRLLGGGGGRLNAPPPMISAPGRRREKRKAAFESSRKIISKSFRSFFGSGQNWGLQGSKFQNFPKRFFDNKIFNFKDRATNLIPSCLSR